MSAVDKHSTPPGWIFKGLDDKQGLWGQLSRDNGEQNPEFEEQRKAREQVRKLQNERDEAIRISKLPKAQQRDREYRQKQLRFPIRADHTKDLLDRGLDDLDIRKLGVFSTGAGYAIPIRAMNGLMVGAQVKILSGGYRWESAGLNQLSETGELPLAIWGNTIDPNRIVFTEGTGVKPYLAAKRFPNSLVIGASGGRWTTSSKQLGQILASFPDSQLILLPDGGSTLNKAVIDGYRGLKEFVAKQDRELLIGWWGQISKSCGDIDEISNDRLVEIVSWERFERFCKQSAQSQRALTKFSDMQHRKRSRVLPEIKQQNRLADLEYKTPCELERICSDAIANKTKYILDISPPGSGKSTKIADVRSVIGVSEYMYISSQHRNPTTPGVETAFSDVPSRHDGLYINPDKNTPSGSPWLQTSQPSGAKWQMTAGNCELSAQQRAWRETGHADIDGKNPICNLCPHNAVCHIASGDGYGYKHQRNSTLAQSRVRISPMSLPNPDSHDYSSTLAIWDDEEQSVIRKVVAVESDIDKAVMKLLSADPELAVKIEPLSTAIKRKMSEATYHSHDWESIIEELEIDDLDGCLHKAAAILSPDLAKLRLSQEDVDREHPMAKWGFSVKSDNITVDAIASNWLVSLLEIMSGKVFGTVRIKGSVLTVKQRDSYHSTIGRKTALTVILNATKPIEHLALELDCHPSEILVISHPTPTYPNQTIAIVEGMGSIGSARVKSMDNRIDFLQSGIAALHGDCSVIDKSKERTDRGLWHRDSVGSNAYRHDTALLLMGMPVSNLGELADKFTCLTGKQTAAMSKDPEFQAYVKQLTAAATIQAVGRLRAQHRPDTELFVYIASDREDFPLQELMSAYPGAKLKVVAAEDLSVEAVGSHTRLKIEFTKLLIENPNITRAEAAMSVGVATSTLTKLFQEFGLGYKLGSLLLYKSLYSKSDLLNSDLSNWSKHLDPDVLAHVETVLDSPDTEIATKAEEIANVVRILNSHQLTALFEAIGSIRTEFIIGLLRYHACLAIPLPEL